MAEIINLAERMKEDEQAIIDWLNGFDSLCIVGRMEDGDVHVHYSSDDVMAALGLLTYGAWAIMEPDE